MKRLTASILALGLAAAVGTASAQSYGYQGNDPYYRNQGYSQPGYQQPYPDRYGNSSGAVYDYARVLRVDPVFGSGYASTGSAGQRCRTERVPVEGGGSYYGDGYANDGYVRNDGYRDDGYYGNDGYRTSGGTNTGRTVATVLGGIVGAAIGSQVGGGSARYATSAIGSMVGGIAGRQIYEQSARNRNPQSGLVTVCDPVRTDGRYGNSGYYGNDGRYYNAGNTTANAYDVTYEYAGRQFTTRTNYHPGDRMRVRVDVRPE